MCQPGHRASLSVHPPAQPGDDRYLHFPPAGLALGATAMRARGYQDTIGTDHHRLAFQCRRGAFLPPTVTGFQGSEVRLHVPNKPLPQPLNPVPHRAGSHGNSRQLLQQANPRFVGDKHR
jgi:hypothetical protein